VGEKFIGRTWFTGFYNIHYSNILFKRQKTDCCNTCTKLFIDCNCTSSPIKKKQLENALEKHHNIAFHEMQTYAETINLSKIAPELWGSVDADLITLLYYPHQVCKYYYDSQLITFVLNDPSTNQGKVY